MKRSTDPCSTCRFHPNPVQIRLGLCLSPRENEPEFWIAKQCVGYEAKVTEQKRESR